MYFRKSRRLLAGFRFPRPEVATVLACIPALLFLATRACHPNLLFAPGYKAQSILSLTICVAAGLTTVWMFVVAHVLYVKSKWLLDNAEEAEAALRARD